MKRYPNIKVKHLHKKRKSDLCRSKRCVRKWYSNFWAGTKGKCKKCLELTRKLLSIKTPNLFQKISSVKSRLSPMGGQVLRMRRYESYETKLLTVSNG